MDELITKYKNNPDLVYQTWFINNDDRLKAFRSIKKGVIQVIDDIKNDNFPNGIKGSSLGFVLKCITEQKEVFKGAKHPFDWKPKMRIPDIYENQKNKKYFGQFLENCMNTTNEENGIMAEMNKVFESVPGRGEAEKIILEKWVPLMDEAVKKSSELTTRWFEAMKRSQEKFEKDLGE